MQHQLFGGQSLGDAARRVTHAFQLAVAQRFQGRDTARDRHRRLDGAQQLQALAQVRRSQEPPHLGQRLAHASGRRGFQQRVDLHAGIQVLPGHQVQQRTAARQHRAISRHHARRLQQNLRRARGDNARQRPARNREGPLLCTRGQQQSARVHDARFTRHRIRHLEPFLGLRRGAFGHRPDGCARHVARARLLERSHQRRAMPIVFTEDAPVSDGSGGDGAVDLAARRRLFIQQHGVHAQRGRQRRRRQARRTRAHHQQIALRCFDHACTLRAPNWRSIFMPSRTAVMQPCWFAWPSMVTRQS
ncbi:hypothetical protein D3C73_1026120 [compost metagenome]